MVASNTLELPYYKGIGRQRGRSFGAPARVIGRTAILLLRKYIVPAAERVGDDLLEIAVPEAADVVSGKKSFKTAAKSVGRQTLRKQLGSGKQKGSFPVKNLKRSSWSREEMLILKLLFIIMTDLKNFRYQPFVAVSGNPCVKVRVVDNVLSSHEQEYYPTTCLDENSIEFEFQTYRNVYVDSRQRYLALNIKLVKGRDFDF